MCSDMSGHCNSQYSDSDDWINIRWHSCQKQILWGPHQPRDTVIFGHKYTSTCTCSIYYSKSQNNGVSSHENLEISSLPYCIYAPQQKHYIMPVNRPALRDIPMGRLSAKHTESRANGSLCGWIPDTKTITSTQGHQMQRYKSDVK